MKNTLKIIVSIVGFTFLFSSCSKKEDTPVPANQTQKVSLNFNFAVGDKAVNFSDVFTNATGEKFTLSMFRFYVSNVRLVKSDNTEQTVSGSYFLAGPNNPVFELGKVQVGDYKGVKFAVGVDSVTNHKDPTVYPASNPLAIQSPAIHWSWNSGYIFMMIEGTVDTTANNSDVLTYGQYSHRLLFHIGMDKLYKKVELTGNTFTINADVEKQVNIKADFNKFLTNVNIKSENVTHTFINEPLAIKTSNNISTMFSLVP